MRRGGECSCGAAPLPTLTVGSTASPWLRSSSGWRRRACGSTKHEACSHRTARAGGTRRYSANDLLRLRRIADLMASGVNLTGVRMLLDLQDENRRLRREVDARQLPREGC